MTNLEALQDEVGRWAAETFQHQTDWRIVRHLREEAVDVAWSHVGRVRRLKPTRIRQ